VSVGVGEGTGVSVGTGVGVAVSVAVAVGVAVRVGVVVRVTVPVLVGVAVRVAVGVGVSVAVRVAVAVPVTVGRGASGSTTSHPVHGERAGEEVAVGVAGEDAIDLQLGRAERGVGCDGQAAARDGTGAQLIGTAAGVDQTKRKRRLPAGTGGSKAMLTESWCVMSVESGRQRIAIWNTWKTDASSSRSYDRP
jgi:hypothetical protein